MCRACVSSLIADKLTFGVSQPNADRRQFMAYAVTATAAAMTAPRKAFAADGAEVIFRNGTIIPMTRARHAVEALAIGGGKILGVGSAADVAALGHSATRIVDLKGRTLLPGFVDPHHHTCLSALFAELLIDVGYAKYAERRAVIAALKSAVATTPPGQWIRAGNYDNLLQGGDLSMQELDGISTTHPIFILYVNGHAAAANTMAFRGANIPADVGDLPGGGRFGRSPDGKLDGLIYEEPALRRFLAVAIPAITSGMMAKALVAYTKQVAAVGNTTLHEPGTVKPEWIEPLAKLSNTLATRLSASFSADQIEASKAFAALGTSAKARTIPESRLSLYGIKFWADGSNQTETAAQTERPM